MRAPVLGIFVAVLASGCSVEGEVSITFLLPEADNLSPAGGNVTLAEVALTTFVPGEQPARQSRRLLDGSEGLDIGTIPIAEGVSLEVELRSPTQRLIGYGRTATPFDVAPEGVTQVEIVVRRPFAYVTGGARVDTFDSALDPALPFKGGIAASPAPSAIVSTHAGDALIAVSDTDLRLISTSTHAPMEYAPVPLQRSASSIALSPDDQYIVVGHHGADGGVSVIKLADVTGETASANFAALGDVGAVGIGPAPTPEQAPVFYALLSAAKRDIDCAVASGNSSIVAGSVDAPAEILTTALPAALVTDIALDPDTGAVVIADVCGDEIAVMYPLLDASARTPLQSLRRPTALAALGGRIWSVGAQPATAGSGAFHIVGNVGFDGAGASLLEMPVTQEVARSLDFTDQGQFAEQRMDADELVALDLAVLPGGAHVGILSRGFYHGEEQSDILFGPIIPEIWLNAWEYLLVDTASGVPVQRVRTRCDLDWRHNAWLDRFACIQAPGQDTVDGAAYVPGQVSILYGAR